MDVKPSSSVLANLMPLPELRMRGIVCSVHCLALFIFIGLRVSMQCSYHIVSSHILVYLPYTELHI